MYYICCILLLATLPLQDAQILSEGSVVERDLKSGETHQYTINLRAGDYLAATLLERGIDAKFSAFAPDGVQLADEITTIGNFDTLIFQMIASASGEFRLDVAGVSREPGRYNLKIGAIRPATDNDRDAVEVYRARRAGARFERQGTPQSLRSAIEEFSKALAYFQKNGDLKAEAEARVKIGNLHFYLDERSTAIEYLEQALKLHRAANSRDGEAIALNNLGAVYQDIGEPVKAAEYFSQSLPVIRESGDKYREAIALHNLGWVYHSTAEFRKASEFYREAAGLWPATGHGAGEAQTLNNLGLVYYQLGEFPRAQEYFERALERRRALKDGRGEAQTLGNLAATHSVLGDDQKARGLYQESLAVARRMEDRVSQARALVGLADIAGPAENSDTILAYISEALNAARSTTDRRMEATALLRLGDIHRTRGETAASADRYEEAMALQTASGEQRMLAETLLGKVRLMRDTGRLDEALPQMERALDLVESLRGRVAEPELRSSFLATTQTFYESYVDLLMSLHEREPSGNYAVAAWQATERARARGLLDALAEHQAEIRQGIEPGLLEREQQLQLALNTKDLQWRDLLASARDQARAAQVKRELDELLDRFSQLQGEIRSRSPRYAVLTQPGTISLQTLRQHLDADSLLLEYWLGQERSFLWAVTADSITSFVLPPASAIEQTTREYFAALTSRPLPQSARGGAEASPVRPATAADPAKSSASRLASSLSETLSETLLGPVADRLGRPDRPGRKRVIVVSHGALQYLPFAALPIPGGSNPPALLLDDHEVIHLPSASVLAALRSESARPRDPDKLVAIFADPVFSTDDARFNERQLENAAARQSPPAAALSDFRRLRFSRVEADAIASLVPGKSQFKAVDFQASRAAALSPDLGQYRILHFATHGLVNSLHPELSGLVFSTVDKNGQPQDGMLRLHEIFNLSLNAELVVLSACQTALGKEIKGEGLIGLTRGFMYAGAPRVVASLWNVEDRATAELMKRFYEGMLKRQLKPAAALREAQLALMRDKRWSSPYYWAGFILQGDWR